MEITLESIISLIGLFLGGTGIGGFFFWKQKRRQQVAEARMAEAEAKLKVAEAKNSEVDTVKSMQEAYEKMFEQVNSYLDDATKKVEGYRQEKDYYKNALEEQREEMKKLTKQVYEIQVDGARKRGELQISINQLKAQMRNISPLTCGVLHCQFRQPVIISDDGEVSIRPEADASGTAAERAEADTSVTSAGRPEADALGTAAASGTAAAAGTAAETVDIEPIDKDAL